MTDEIMIKGVVIAVSMIIFCLSAIVIFGNVH